MKTKRIVRGKRLEGTPYLISEEEKLGKGTYGEVYRAYNRDNPSQQLVVKIISLLESDNQQTIETQLQMIRQLPWHQNLVNCVKARIESSHNLYIIMEYCNQGSLEKFIQKMTLLSEEKIWDIITQICKGYQVLYDAHLLHRDIKPENILIHNKIFKLADFGLSKRIKNHTMNENLSYAGSPLYIAPEIIEKHEGTSKVDVFSLGSVIYELAYDGANPFYKQTDQYKNHYQYYEKRKKAKLNLPAKNKKGEVRSEQLRKLIASMLQFDEEKRISWEDIFSHPKIDINNMKTITLKRAISQEEQILQELKNSLIQVRKSSAKMQPIDEKDNVRSQSQHLTLQLISFQQFLQHSQLRNIQNVMLRLKITELTILHCNSKINNLIRDNQKHRKLHKHISQGLESIVIEGLLYLLKINLLIRGKISGYQQTLMSDLMKMLEKDREMLTDQFKREAIIFKHLQLEKQLKTVDSYDLRVYQNQLYSILTQYCDYPKQAKQIVAVIISILMDIYDSSLKLNDLIDNEKITWQKYQDMNEIQTKMDEFCYSRLQPHEFYSYLMKKEHVKVEDNNQPLKRLGLLFT